MQELDKIFCNTLNNAGDSHNQRAFLYLTQYICKSAKVFKNRKERE